MNGVESAAVRDVWSARTCLVKISGAAGNLQTESRRKRLREKTARRPPEAGR